MKHLLLLLLSCIPICVSAQTLTESQKQEALECVTKFCNLLVRFSNGERTLNTQIDALCSGADCSAYDDIKTNSEKTLRNYLMAIQQKYPNKLAMDITAPSLADSKTVIEPEIGFNVEYKMTGNGEASTEEIISQTLENVKNTYIVFNVVQKYPSLNALVNKNIIYDTEVGKITGFVKENGAYMNFLNGLDAYFKNNLQSAINYFEKAAQNERFAQRKACYGLAMSCCAMMQDFEKAIYYAEKLNDSFEIAYFRSFNCILKENWEETYPHIVQLESLMKTKAMSEYRWGKLFELLAHCYVNPQVSFHDKEKGLSYLKQAVELGNAKGGYLIFIYFTIFGEEFTSYEEALESLLKSAESGYPPAFYHWGRITEYGLKDSEAALLWYEKSAQAGNRVGMASVGKLLIKKGEKAKGIEWLKKSLEGNELEMQLQDMELTIGSFPPWPKSRADVEMLLNKNNASTTSSSTGTGSAHTPLTSSTSSNYTSNSNSSTNSYTPSNNYSYRYRREFNEAKDEYCVALSMGYVQKQWVYDLGDTKEKVDVFGEDKYTNGVQFGIRIDPQFKYGFGINTGLYYEYYFDKSQDRNEEGIDYYCRAEEHSLYMPIHLKYSLNFSKWFQLAFYGGVGLDYGISGEIYARSNGETLNSRTQYDAEFDMERFNASIEYGAAIRVNRFQMNVSMSKGLINMSGSDEYKVKQDKLINVGMSIYF